MTFHDPPPPLPAFRPVDYAPGAGSVRLSRGFDYSAMVTHLFGWAVFTTVILLILLLVVPRFEEVFMDFKLDLPSSTRLLLRMSRFLTHGGVERLLLVFAVPIPFLHAAAAGFLYPRLGRGGRLAYRLLLTLALAVLVLVFVIALFMPQIALMEGISGGGNK